MKRLFACITGVLLATTLVSSAASHGVEWGNNGVRTITMEEGLPTNCVRSVVQDKYGFMWFGTDNGLCRYDGYGVQVFYISQLGIDQYVSALAAAEDGMLVGTSKGPYFFHFRNEQFEPLGEHIKTVVSDFSFDAEGDIWIATAGSGLYSFSKHSHETRHYPMKELNGMVASVFVDSNNQVWALSNSVRSSLFRLNKAKNIFEPFPAKGEVPTLVGMSMMQDESGTLLVGTWDEGLIRMNSDGSIEQLLSPKLTGVGLHIHSLVKRGQNEILIGCDDGLIAYDMQRRSWQRLSGQCLTDRCAGERFVYGVARDNEGGIWMGTFYGGVSYLSPLGDRFASFTDREGLHGNVVGRFVEDSNRKIWVATDDGGLNCYDAPNNRFVDYPGMASMRDYNVHGLWSDDNSSLWIGTYGDGVIHFNTTTGAKKVYQLDNAKKLSSCYAFFRDSRHQLWATSMDGVNLYDEKIDAFRRIKSFKMLTIDIEEDNDGDIWFATQGGGLWRYHPNNRSWKQYQADDNDTLSVPSNQVNCIYKHENGTLYIATTKGLCIYQPATDNFKTIPIDCDTEEFNSVVFNQDELWLSSSKGIVRFIPGESTQVFNRKDGLLSNQFQPNAGLMASDGRIYFGSTKGMQAFFPYQIKINKIAPQVFITSVELYNNNVEVGSERLKEALNHVQQLDLYHGDDMLTLAFASLSYISPEKNQYAYRLEGFDKDWHYSGAEHKATYTNIPAGTYTFKVKATNNDGVWSAQEGRLKIVVHPPFWWSLPAKIFYLLLIGLLIYLYTQMRLRKEKRRHQRELRQLNEKKEQEIRDARLQFFTMIAHEIRTPVTLIIGPLETLKAEWEKVGKHLKDNASINSTLDVIDRNAQRLLNLVNQLLDFNKVQQEGLHYHFKLQNISKMMHAVAERFEPTLRQNGATFEVAYPDDNFSAIIDNEAITKVISNLMTNATKYTKDFVRLSCVLVDKEHFRIEVEDNGIGISEQDQTMIFNPFYQAKDNKPGTGIGLNIVKNLVSAHHGMVEVKSQEGRGSTFIVTLPVSQPDVEVGEDTSPVILEEDETDKDEQNTASLNTDSSEEETVALPVMLVVEDDVDMRHFIAAHFKDTYEVVTAENGVEGLQQLRKHEVALIVSDWMMPEMDGAEFCRQVRENQSTSHIPFIMLTAKTDNDSKTEGMNCGADAYIEKPFSMKYLEACIRNLIEMRRLLQSKFSHTPLEPITEIATTPVDNDFLVTLNQLIEDNLNNKDLNVQFVANELGMSRSAFFSKVKALADVTPNELIQLVRLKKAAQLIQENKYRISEVAYMVGFSSPSYFSKCFQKQFGVKPIDFIG